MSLSVYQPVCRLVHAWKIVIQPVLTVHSDSPLDSSHNRQISCNCPDLSSQVLLHFAGANAMAISLQRGERVTLSKVDAFADGVAVKQVGAETFRLCQQLVDGVLLVDNRAISAAIKDVFNETRSILEPAGAVAVAGAKAYLKQHQVKVSAAFVKVQWVGMLHTTLHCPLAWGSCCV